MQEIKDFLKKDSASGILLCGAAVLALLCANTPLLSTLYAQLLDMPVEVRLGPLFIGKPLLLWINDGLMAVFFFLIGLELKREVLEGELSEVRKVILPAVGALGGMVAPALIYVGVNWDSPETLRGWAIPAATDIAFAMGVLALLGPRVPLALKVFLVSLAVFDDVGAIIVIALFYTHDLSVVALVVALSCLIVLYVMNRFMRLSEPVPYMLVGFIMWAAVLKSGVHATLAGIALAMFIPLRCSKDPDRSPAKELEHDLHPSVSFFILPVFAFANAGLPLAGLSLDSFMHPVPLGIMLGLLVGKQLGVFGFCWIGVKLGMARLPAGVNWMQLWGVAVLCGVGFTMSLFIGSLAFSTETSAAHVFDERLGILAGSIISGVLGYLVLKKILPDAPKK
ncbi:MAG: Na+/H+ antiporter NhaA [Hahellaceae bacterium]|nr:Na+/H+ antiporter NhaA [Hahellaceae bacterium]MCP5168610.1 Na+/H+ antiporter NhaA [Hahellaceae bacterium]